MSEDPHGRPPGTASPATPQEALAEAARHARNAVSETLLTVRSLLDAAALAQGGVPAASHRALEGVAAWLDALATGIAPDGTGDTALTRALAEALDAEIARWELRAQQDPDARAVLRAFLGLRELLWELGVRPAQTQPASDPPTRAAASPRARPRKRRVERVPVRADRSDSVG